MMEEPLSERVITPMTPAMVEAIDTWRFANRIPSRAEAVRQLIERGLKAKGK
jgi:hypothetical protein